MSLVAHLSRAHCLEGTKISVEQNYTAKRPSSPRETQTQEQDNCFFFQVSYYFTENTDFCSFGKRLDSSSRKIVNRETKKARRKGVPSTENSMNQTHKQEHTEGLIYVLSLCNMRKIQTARSMDRWWRNAAILRSLTGSQLRDERWMTCKGVA